MALVGANGAEKTTLLRALGRAAGDEPGCFDGEDIGGPGQARAARHRAGTGRRQVFAPLSVEDNLAGRLRAQQGRAALGIERVCDVSVLKQSARAAGAFRGQRQMRHGKRADDMPRLLLLDEPSMGLAPKLVEEIFACVRAQAASTTIFLVDKNARPHLAVADRACIETGRVVLTGSGARLLATNR